LTALYAAYAEGWSDPAGADARRASLADEAVWLARLVVSLLPGEAEALGLLALMLHAQARRAARRGLGGDYVPLSEQDTSLWDEALIEEAERLLFRAAGLGAPGRYQYEACVQSAHAIRRLNGRADWAAILNLHNALLELTGSPVAALNRAVALANIEGPSAGLAALDEAATDERLARYQPYWAARADLLARNGLSGEARSAYEQAIGLEQDPAIVRFLKGKMSALSG
jgi:RNA polymerase sigma-70 factor (ECF subfamily)